MEEHYINQIVQNLVARFEYVGPKKFDTTVELKELAHPVTKAKISKEILGRIEKEFLDRIQYQREYKGAILKPISVVADAREHEEWYDKWLEENDNNNGSYYWKRLEDFLSKELMRKYGPKSASSIVKSIDDATLKTMRKLASPYRKEFDYKGLVVGYVQSGKTQNFTALIAKAADSGYKFIIVLAGLHNILRRQTQLRLDKELTGMNDLKLKNEKFIDEPSTIKAWERITTARNKITKSKSGEKKIKDVGEFDTINVDPFESICNRSTPTLAIVKKNVTVLDKLIGYLSDASESSREKVPVLIIDDEADQASIDTNPDDPNGTQRTNSRIRTILNLFKRKAYIGYTATPFANVLIDMDAHHSALHYDLYPRNFIVSLPEPDGYFGTSAIFEGGLSKHFVKDIPDEARELIRKGITSNLAKAIDYFILGCAIRNLRGDKLKPMSMLVHLSHKTNIHSRLNEIISDYYKSIKGRYKHKSHHAKLKREFEEIWKSFIADSSEINKIKKYNNQIPNFPSVWKEVGDVLSKIRILELNSKSDDKLDYTSDDEVKVIAIGGNQLSRGLTLDGLMTSYYLRDSNQYDTLLQMGRWFGYRHNYEDLTRIFTTRNIWDYFQHLSVVEQELRCDIRRYDDPDSTPADVALTIRTHSRLTVTSPNKLGAGKTQQTSYSDSLHQTFKFPLDKPTKLQANLDLGHSFVKKVLKGSKFSESWVTGVQLSEKVFDSRFVLTEFLDKYYFEERFNGSGVEYDSLKKYIQRRFADNELKRWKIALAGNINEREPTDLGGIPFNKITRSRIKDNPGFDCGVITDKKHLVADLKEGTTDRSEGRTPDDALLLLYVISSDSKGGNKPGRVDLYHKVQSKKLDVLGFALILPPSIKEPYNRIGQ